MGLGIEGSGLESTAASDIITNASGRLTNFDETQIVNNGTTVTDALEVVNSPPLVMAEASSPSPSPETAKGRGLKKWRRIRRDVSLDGGTNVDNSKLLKRVLSNFAANLNEPVIFSAEVKQTSEGSVSSTNAMLRSFGASVDSFGGIADSGLVIGPMLATETDSENSEDRSSKSSTAASAPKMRQDGREKNRVKNLSGKNLASSVHKGHQGNPRTESSKKARGELFQMEKENSHSSLESDSRSSHPVFVQGSYSATTNGRQSGMPMIYGGETSDEAPGVERELSEELQAGFSRKNAEFEVISDEKFAADTSWAAKDDQSEDNGSSRDLDPLAESIMLLQSVQKELGKEVQKFRDIGNEDFISEDLSEQLKCGEVVEDSSDILGYDVMSLKETANSLRNKVDDTTALLEVKETRIAELEGSISSRLPEGERSSLLELDQVTYRDMELELERLFKQKIEAEVEYLAITRTVQNMRVAVADEIKILEEQKSEQAQMLMKLEDAKYKAAMLKGQSKKLENGCEDIASADETLKLRSSVWKYTSCFFLQLVLFAIILAVFIWQLSPPYNADFVPT